MPRHWAVVAFLTLGLAAGCAQAATSPTPTSGPTPSPSSLPTPAARAALPTPAARAALPTPAARAARPSPTATSISRPTPSPFPASDLAADVIFFNGQIVTMEPGMPRAQALAVLGRDIIAVGTDAEVLGLSGLETEVVDLDGRALLPGFVDTHSHLFNDASQHLGLTLEEAQAVGLQRGTTTMADMFVKPGFLEQMRMFERQGRLKIRTSLYLRYNWHCEVFGDWYMDHPPTLDTGQMLRIPGVKIFEDSVCNGGKGSASSHDSPGKYLSLTEEELTNVVVKLQSLGYQAAIHAINDLSVETALAAIENALDGAPNTSRHRIEHNAEIRPDLLARYGQIGIVPSIPNSSTCWSTAVVDDRGGPTTRSWFTPWRSLLAANPGLHVAWQSDLPWWGLGPIPGLYSLTTRNQINLDGEAVCQAPGWMLDEAVTVEQALRMMTIDAAYALFMEEKIGSLKPGKFADLVILSDNPLTVELDSLIDLEVQMTMVGGGVEHCAPDSAAVCPES